MKGQDFVKSSTGERQLLVMSCWPGHCPVGNTKRKIKNQLCVHGDSIGEVRKIMLQLLRDGCLPCPLGQHQRMDNIGTFDVHFIQ